MTNSNLSDPRHLIAGYQLCASTEGNSTNAIMMVVRSIDYFTRYLDSHQNGKLLTEVTRQEIREFTFFLQHTKCFASHRFTPTQEKNLSGHTVNCYLRSLRAFYSWLVNEEIIEKHPFDKVKIPPPPKKVIPAFSPQQIEQLLSVIDTKTSVGYRNYTMILTLLDTGLRITELCTLTMDKLFLEDGIARVTGKGNKERMIPIGKQVQRALWHYIECCRPDPSNVNNNFVFLNDEGRPLVRRRMEAAMRNYGEKAKLVGIRCSPHTLRHTAAISFLRNGGDLFSLQRLLGHTSLEMTRRYCEVADTDVKRAHVLASPVDNLDLRARNKIHRNQDSKTPVFVKGVNIKERGGYLP
jgi:site-specific recombinase XerD